MQRTRKIMETSEWVSTLPEDQQERYTYKDAVYTGADNFITITCPEHGNFSQRAYSHKQGRGCAKCARENSTSKQRKSQDKFLEDSKIIHPSYDFSRAVYKGAKVKVTVVCPTHGEFQITPADLLGGHGCKSCFKDALGARTRGDTASFTFKAVLEHGTEYDYSDVVYTGSRDKVSIICRKHGRFDQQPDNHLAGAGCPECGKSGYNQNKAGTLYILNSGDTTKVGITNRDVGTRIREIRVSGGPHFDVVSTFHLSEGVVIKNLESEAKAWLKSKYNKVSDKYQGSTECFLSVDLPELIAFITPLATPPESAQADQT